MLVCGIMLGILAILLLHFSVLYNLSVQSDVSILYFSNTNIEQYLYTIKKRPLLEWAVFLVLTKQIWGLGFEKAIENMLGAPRRPVPNNESFSVTLGRGRRLTRITQVTQDGKNCGRARFLQRSVSSGGALSMTTYQARPTYIDGTSIL